MFIIFDTVETLICEMLSSDVQTFSAVINGKIHMEMQETDSSVKPP